MNVFTLQQITPLWSLIDDVCLATSLFDAIVDIYDLESSGIADAPDIGSGIVRANSESAVSYSETDIFGRYSYISGPSIINSPNANNELLGNDVNVSALSLIVAYNVTLQNTFKDAISPLFATMISGSIGPEGGKLDLNNVPFLEHISEQNDDSRKKSAISSKFLPAFSWRSKAVGERLSLAVLGNNMAENINNFTDIIQVEQAALKNLNSFSYIAIPSLDSSNEVVVGLINPDGTSARKRSFTPLGYNAEKVDYGVWNISFDEGFQKVPTLIAQPTWTSSQENVPQTNAQVSLAVKECTLSYCLIYLGCNNTIGYHDDSTSSGWTDMIPNKIANAFVNDHLGLSFLAIDGNFTRSPSMVHGIVNSDILSSNDTLKGRGWTAMKRLSDNEKGYIIPPPEEGGVEYLEYDQAFLWAEIEFDIPFLEVPSLVVTPTFQGVDKKPIWQERFLSGSNPFNDVTYYDQDNDQNKAGKVQVSTFASVEYVTARRALIKVGVIDTWGLLRWGNECLHHISFSFLAVGPMGKSKEEAQTPKKKSKLESCPKRGKGGKGNTSYSSTTFSEEKYDSSTPVSAPSPTIRISPPPSKRSSLRGSRGESTESPPPSHDESLHLWLP